MIRRRAAAAAMLAVAATAATAAIVPAAEAAGTSQIVIDSVSSPPGEPGLLSVEVEASSPITSLTVNIYSGTALELTISDFSQPSNPQDGTWTAQTPITESQLSLGTYQVTVNATDADGTMTGLEAPDPFFFGLYPTVTIAANPTMLSYTEQSVTFTGQVTAYSPQGLPEDVAHQQVLITDSDGGSWPATTDQNGNYSLTVTPNLVDGTGLAASFSASVSSGPAIAQASSSALQLTGDIDPVKITVSVSKSMADYGTRVRFSGVAEYESGGIWFPLASSTIDVTGTDFYSGRSAPQVVTTTDAGGDFTVVLPAQPTTTWTANPAASQYLTADDSQLGLPNSATVTVVLPTRSTSLHVAYNPAGQVTASGCLGLGSAVASFRDLTAPADANLYLQYSQTPSGPWRTLGALGDRKAPSCRGGTGFSGTFGSPALSGHYRVDFTGQLLYQRSVSATQHAATAPTRISSLSVTPRKVSGHGRIQISGQLQQKARSWKGLGRVGVTIYVEPAGGTSWYWFRHTETSSSGKFRISFADPVSGHWVVGYAGNSSHLESLSHIVYVSASGTSANLRHALGAHSLSGRATRALLAAR